MNEIIRPGSGVLFMKIGTHAREELDEIIERKTKEIEDAGYGFWGYGGNTCHPLTMVQPFASAFEKKGQTIHLCMEPMASSHLADPVRADEFSSDGIKWELIPKEINVLGSRYALVIKELRREEFDLPLNQTVVGIGRSQGRAGDLYVNGRVDKACLEVIEHPTLSNTERKVTAHIGLVATLSSPYAVYVRNKN